MLNEPTTSGEDYSNSVIYKIRCCNQAIADTYIGSSKDLNCRRQLHKSVCNNPKSKKSHLAVYKAMRENGGWDNWVFTILQHYPCKNKAELVKKEQEFIDNLKPSLNMVGAYSGMSREEYPKAYYQKTREDRLKKFKCECGLMTSKVHYTRHKRTKRHLSLLIAQGQQLSPEGLGKPQ